MHNSIATSPSLTQSDQFEDLPKWLWLWIPMGYIALHYLLSGISHDTYERYLGGGELGTNELLTVVLLVIAVLFGIRGLLLLRGISDWRLKLWMFLGTLGCLYFGGEEASWGQHLIGWESSEAWKAFNDQHETNLHNSDKYGPLLDQLPRNLLTIGILVGAVIAPIRRRIKGVTLDPQSIHFWIWPTWVCLPIGIIAVAITWPEGIYERVTGREDPERFNITSGEVKEWCIAFFLMLYLHSFNTRLAQLRRALGK